MTKNYQDLSKTEKSKIIKDAIKGSNKDQRKLVEKAEGWEERLTAKYLRCEHCNRRVDADWRSEDGHANCLCAEGESLYDHDWDAIGYNQCLDDLQSFISQELTLARQEAKREVAEDIITMIPKLLSDGTDAPNDYDLDELRDDIVYCCQKYLSPSQEKDGE